MVWGRNLDCSAMIHVKAYAQVLFKTFNNLSICLKTAARMG